MLNRISSILIEEITRYTPRIGDIESISNANVSQLASSQSLIASNLSGWKDRYDSKESSDDGSPHLGSFLARVEGEESTKRLLLIFYSIRRRSKLDRIQEFFLKLCGFESGWDHEHLEKFFGISFGEVSNRSTNRRIILSFSMIEASFLERVDLVIQ